MSFLPYIQKNTFGQVFIIKGSKGKADVLLRFLRERFGIATATNIGVSKKQFDN